MSNYDLNRKPKCIKNTGQEGCLIKNKKIFEIFSFAFWGDTRMNNIGGGGGAAFLSNSLRPTNRYLG